MTKTIFITGASSGIGKASALLFADNGWSVIATMRNPKMAEGLEHNNIKLLHLDVSDHDQVNPTILQVVEDYDIDVVLNNAGYGLIGSFETTPEEQITKIVNTNLLGVMRVTKAFIPHFKKKGTGMFITITSIGGLVAFPFFSVYHATKWAIEGWSESLAYELGALGITVKTVSPGTTKTQFAASIESSPLTHEYEQLFNYCLNEFTNPEAVKHHATPNEIADVIYEAATDDKSTLRYIAGEEATQLFETRMALGTEGFRKMINQKFLGIKS